MQVTFSKFHHLEEFKFSNQHFFQLFFYLSFLDQHFFLQLNIFSTKKLTDQNLLCSQFLSPKFSLPKFFSTTKFFTLNLLDEHYFEFDKNTHRPKNIYQILIIFTDQTKFLFRKIVAPKKLSKTFLFKKILESEKDLIQKKIGEKKIVKEFFL